MSDISNNQVFSKEKFEEEKQKILNKVDKDWYDFIKVEIEKDYLFKLKYMKM